MLLGLGVLAALVGCGGGSRSDRTSASPAVAPPATPAAPAVVDERPVLLFVGTSLTAGYGLDQSDAFPAVFQRKLDDAGLGYRVVNAGVSG